MSRSDRSKWSWAFLNKELACSTEDKRRWIDPQHPALSIRQQFAWLGKAPSSHHYRLGLRSEENLHLLRRMDELNMETPFFGSGGWRSR